MPLIKFTYNDLGRIIRSKEEKDELIDILPMIGSDIEDYDDEEVKVEFFPNRPDYLSVEGVARALKGFLKIEEGLPHYHLESSNSSITIDPQLKNIRPYTSCCLVKGIHLTEDKLRRSWTPGRPALVLGRDRKKSSIGIHNLRRAKRTIPLLSIRP